MAYQREQNPLAEFLETRCVIRANAWIDGGSLYAQYVQWTDTAQADPISRSELRRLLLELPGIEEKRKDTARGYSGIRLRTPDDR